MPESRKAFLVGARAATGAVGVAVAVGLIAAATFLPLPTARLEPESASVTPAPAAGQVICPGAVLRLGDESGANATDATAIGTASSVRGATTGDVESRPLASTDAGGGLGAPVVLSVPSTPEAGVVGAQSQSVDTSDYRGFAAAECSAPSSDAWLVGGSTAVGRTTLLTIANPGAVSATVTIEVFGEKGLVDAPGTNGIVVAAGSQRVLSLAGFAPSLESLAVHVTSRGGPVTANLQQSIVRGIDPGGVDIVGATGSPAVQQVIPGVIIGNSIEVQGMLGLEGYADLDSVLRLLAPGEAPAAVTVRITPATPEAEVSSFSLTLDPGVVTDVPLDEFDDGHYSVEIEADVPVVAAARTSAVSGDDVDLAWFTVAEPLTGDALLAIASGPAATLSLSNTTSSSISATLDGVTVTVGAGTAVSVEVDDARTHLLAGGTGLVASIGYADGGKLGSYAVSASAAEEPPVTVYP